MWGQDEKTIPKIKKRLDTATEKLKSYYYEDNRATSAELKALFNGNVVFNNPKSLNFLQHILRFTSIRTERVQNINFPEPDTILDFFSGSATTAHAVMRLNAEDGGNRKFIMVQMPEVCAEGTEAAKAGYKTICEIGKERIHRAGEKIRAEAGLTDQNPDIGFRVLKLDETNMSDVYYTPSETTQDMLASLGDNIKPDRSGLDLLFGCLIEWGLPLSMPHTHEKIGKFTLHTYNAGDLIACFDENVSESLVREIANRQPLRVVFRDISFTSSPEKINLFEIFKLLAPNTKVRVI